MRFPVYILLFVYGLTFLLQSTATAQQNLQVIVGISLPLKSPFPFLNKAAQDLLNGLTLFEEWLSSDYQWNVTLENGTMARLLVNFMVLENYGDSNITATTYSQLYNDSSVDVVFGPVATSFSLIARNVSETAGRLLLGTLVGAQDFYMGTAKAYSVYPSTSRYMLPSMSALRVAGARNATMLIDSDPFNLGQCHGFLDNLADYSLDVLKTWNVQAVYTSEPINTTKNELRDTLEEMISVNADIMVMCTDTPSMNYILRQLKDRYQYTPKALIMGNINGNFPSIVDPELAAFAAGHVVMANGVKFSDEWFGSFDNYASRVYSRFGSYPTSQMATGTVAGLVLASAIQSAGSLNDEKLAAAIQRSNLDTFFGTFQFASDHAQLRSTILLQYLPNTTRQIDLAPYDSSLSNLTNIVVIAGPSRIQEAQFVYPMPTWAERNYNGALTPTEWVMYALSIASSLISLALLIYSIKHRQHPVMRASTFSFMVLILVGTIISNSTVFVWKLKSNNIATCASTPVLLGMGFVITFGALFIKSWRIHMLFNEKSLKMFKITNLKLFLILLGFMLVQGAIVIVIAVFQAGVVMITPDLFRPSTWYLRCVDNTISFTFVVICVALDGILLCFGLYLAIRIRKLKHKLYNESRILTFVIYNITLLAVLVTILQFVGTVDRQVLFIIRSLAIVQASSVTVISLYANKIYYIRTVGDTKSPIGGSNRTTASTEYSSRISRNQARNSSSSKEQVDRLFQENQGLKQKLAELESVLQQIADVQEKSQEVDY